MTAGIPPVATGLSQARRGLVVFGALGIFLAGFALGRTGTGVRAEAAEEAIQRAREQTLAAAQDSLPDAIKDEIFLQETARALPLGLVAKGWDANQHLVLYASRVPQWRALQPKQQEAIMGVIGASYTAFSLQNGIIRNLSQGHPVISLASASGEVLATRDESGKVILFGAAALPAPTPEPATVQPPPAAVAP